jgi:diguanylate cyclase
MPKREILVRMTRKASLLLVGFIFFSANALTQFDDFSQKIRLADEIKSTNFTKFSELLEELQKSSAQLTPEQQEYVSFLSGYQLVYSRELKADGITKLTELANSAKSEIVRFRSTALIINMFVVSRNYGAAFSYLETFNQLVDEISDPDSKSLGLGIMSLLFNQINTFDVGLFYAEELINSAQSSRYLCFGMQFKLEAAHRMKNYLEFEQSYQKGLDTCADAKQPIYKNLIRSYRIEQLIETAPSEALNLLDQAHDEVEQTSYSVLITLYKALYSDAYFRMGKNKAALQVGLPAVEKTPADEVNYAVLILYSTLYQVYKANHDYQTALEYFETYVAKQKAFDDEKTAGLLAYNMAKAEVEVKNQRIALLNKDNELLYLQKSVYQQEVRQTRVLLAVLVVVLSIAVFLAYRGIVGRQRFKKIAEFDQLTGISNRYHFNNQAAVALEYCEKNAKPVAAVLFDLDHFKAINDTHGHAAGDWALQQVVKTCRNFMRNNDVFGRIGGEEFAVVLPGCQTDKAVLLAEICRDAIAGINTAESGKQFPLTASFGVSGSDSSGYQLKQLLADADAAMYRAKEAGRNQVTAFADELEAAV